MLPLRDENPHPPGFKPTVTYALIIINVIVFVIEIAYTGQFLEFNNQNAFDSKLYYRCNSIHN
jgi:membrane associated rhomboid family serine protease